MIRLFYTLLTLFVCMSQGCVSDNEPEGPSLKAGDPLPVFSVVLSNGDVVSTSSLKGKVPVIVFFNTGCPDCQEELPVIQQLWDKFQSSQLVEIVLISREESAEEIIKYWEENHFTMPFSAQENREVYSLFASSVIPRIYIADTEGIIRASFGDSDLPSLQSLLNVITEIWPPLEPSLQTPQPQL